MTRRLLALAVLGLTFSSTANAATINVLSETFAEVLSTSEGFGSTSWTAERRSTDPYSLFIHGKADTIAFPIPFFDESRAASIFLLATQLAVLEPTPLAISVDFSGGFAFIGTPIFGGEGTGEARLSLAITDANNAPLFSTQSLGCAENSGFAGTWFSHCDFSFRDVFPFEPAHRRVNIVGLLAIDALAEADGQGFQTATTEGVLSVNVTPVPEPSTFVLLALALVWLPWLGRRRSRSMPRG